MSSQLILLLGNNPAHYLWSSQWTGVKKNLPPCCKTMLLAGSRVLSAMTHMSPLKCCSLSICSLSLTWAPVHEVTGSWWHVAAEHAGVLLALLLPTSLRSLLKAPLLSTYWWLLPAWCHLQFHPSYRQNYPCSNVSRNWCFKTAANHVRCHTVVYFVIRVHGIPNSLQSS